MKLNIIALTLCTCLCSNTAYAANWQNWFQTPDQQAAKLLQQGKAKQAANKFVDSKWRAIAAYRAGYYQQAAKLFATMKNEFGYYNHGNALAHTGAYEQAIKSYEQALKLSPNNKDAKHNRDLLKKLLQQQKKQNKKIAQNQQQNNKQPQTGNKDNNKQNKSQNNNKSKQSDKAGNKQGNNQGQNKAKSQTKHQQKSKNKQQAKSKQQNKQQTKQTQSKQQKSPQNPMMPGTKTIKSQSAKQQPGNKKANMSRSELEQQQAEKQWMRRVPDNPGGLLRQKFLRDYYRRHQANR